MNPVKYVWAFLLISEGFATQIETFCSKTEAILTHLTSPTGALFKELDDIVEHITCNAIATVTDVQRLVNATVGVVQEEVKVLSEEVKYLRAASQIAFLMQGLQFMALVTYVVAIAVMSCRKRVEKVRAKMEEEQVELLEKRLQDRRSLRRKEAKPTAQ